MALFIAMGTLGYSCGPVISSAITQFLGMPKMPLMTILGIVWALLMFKFVPKLSLTEPVIERIDFKTAFKRILTNHKLNILNVIAMLKTMIMSSCFILLPFLWKIWDINLFISEWHCSCLFCGRNRFFNQQQY